LYNDRTNKGLLVHHGLFKEQQQVDRCRQLADDFFADLYDWRNKSPLPFREGQGEGSTKRAAPRRKQPPSSARPDTRPVRVHDPNTVANHLSPALDVLARQVKAAGKKLSEES